jgi:RNA polymerase sigma-70 factor (ECF subfamily)
MRRNKVQAAGGSTAQERLEQFADPWKDLQIDPPTTGETASLVQRALAQIRPTVEPTTWDAFWNTTVLGRSAPEVADELGLSAANVRKIKSRLLRRLRQQLGDR